MTVIRTGCRATIIPPSLLCYVSRKNTEQKQGKQKVGFKEFEKDVAFIEKDRCLPIFYLLSKHVDIWLYI